MALLVQTAAAQVRCATPEPPKELLEHAAEMKAQENAMKAAGIQQARAPIAINAWFHVIAASDAVEDANLTVEYFFSSFIHYHLTS